MEEQMKSVKPIPDGYHTANTYLIVDGLDKLLDFLKDAFDAKEIERIAMPDGTIMHAEVRIGDSVIMMGPPKGEFGAMPSMVYLYVEDCDSTYQNALKAGATSEMEPADQFYGDRNAGVKDFAGNLWWIATHIEDVSEEELQKRAMEMAKQYTENGN